jgi:hypothetical protein
MDQDGGMKIFYLFACFVAVGATLFLSSCANQNGQTTTEQQSRAATMTTLPPQNFHQAQMGGMHGGY